MTFPEGFQFGTATAAYQIEGAVNEDGRTPSIWDTFTHEPGHILNGDTGDIADDHYHRWEDDFKLLRDLGANAYRFSIGIPRIIPTPDGKPNAAGLDFYERLVDRLREYGIAPVVTLYHWDLPQYLGDRGGWLNRETAYRIADYTGIVADRIGDRVDTFITLNEPWCAAHLSYGATEQAPGLGAGPLAFKAAHHLNLAHGLMTQAIRASVPRETPKIDVTLNLQVSRGEEAAVHRLDLIGNRVFLDPMLRGRFPAELLALTRGICDWSFVEDGDLETIHQPIDALGLNYYSTSLVKLSDRPQFPQYPGDPADMTRLWELADFSRLPEGEEGAIEGKNRTEQIAELAADMQISTTAPGAADIDWLPTPGPHTEMGWNIDPAGLYETLVRLHDDYGVPLVVTENGMACADEVVEEPAESSLLNDSSAATDTETTAATGNATAATDTDTEPATVKRVHDADRIDYLTHHLAAVEHAIDDGADVRGYFAWSLMDNFEWAQGYCKRFGLTYVDYPTEERIPKDSYRWYRDFIAAHRQ
ncbi:glycoside hydrolase family 1 protein [Bifidobacterium choloepi]|nr:family 1 glycosylhydrolase [Bifidobacterium choloepi]